MHGVINCDPRAPLCGRHPAARGCSASGLCGGRPALPGPRCRARRARCDGGSRLGLLLPSPQPPSGSQRETDCAPNQGRGWSPGSLLPVRLTASSDTVTAASPCASPRRPPSLLPCHRGAFHKVTPATQPRGPGPLPAGFQPSWVPARTSLPHCYIPRTHLV